MEKCLHPGHRTAQGIREVGVSSGLGSKAEYQHGNVLRTGRLGVHKCLKIKCLTTKIK